MYGSTFKVAELAGKFTEEEKILTKRTYSSDYHIGGEMLIEVLLIKQFL